MKLVFVRWRIICGTVWWLHRVRFVALLTLEPVVGEILEKIDDGQMGVILKRMMVRAASRAERYGVQALVTGEALGGPARR